MQVSGDSDTLPDTLSQCLAQELDFLAKHPGGFDREFFEERLPGLLEQWREWAGVDETGYLVEVVTARGETIEVAYARAALSWAGVLHRGQAARTRSL